MAKRARGGDLNQIASSIVEQTTDIPDARKNPAAVALGRLGGLKGGKARAESLSKKRRSEIAKKAAKRR
ncbi:MAG: histone H1, partial [Verrucomicrobiota bacterium]|nr:histone H1 [Verrucomicrobiota bacterium]